MTQSTWYIQLFGGLKAVHGDLVVTHFRTQKTADLLAYLAYYADRRHGREKLIELLWPEVDPEIGRSRFKQTLALLRRVLEPGQIPAGSVLATPGGNVGVHPTALSTDVGQFTALIRTAEATDCLWDKITLLTRAVELYTGELLPGCSLNWAEHERRRLADQYVGVLCQLALIHEQVGDLSSAMVYANRAVSIDPLREEAHCHLMHLYAADGQPSAVWRQYNELAQILREHYGEAALEATRALAEKYRAAAWSSLVARADVSPDAPANLLVPARPCAVPAVPAPAVDQGSDRGGARRTDGPHRQAYIPFPAYPVRTPISRARLVRRLGWLAPVTGALVLLGIWIGQFRASSLYAQGGLQSDGRGHIVFAAHQRGSLDIYRIDADGTHEQRLTNNDTNEYAPAWSPDGTKIAYTSDRDGRAEIYLMDADGSHQTQLTHHPSNNAFPSWSQDGRTIEFVSDRDGHEQIYVINADGSEENPLTGSRERQVDAPGKDRPRDTMLLAGRTMAGRFQPDNSGF